MLSSRLVALLRFALLFGLTFSLMVACQGDRALPKTTDWVTGNLDLQLTVETVPNAPPFLWWEAEQPTQTNFPPSDRNPFAPANPTEAAVLSGDQWIGVEGKHSAPLFLTYTVTVPTPDTYTFYVRKFWQHGPFRWRWDDQPWQTVSSSMYLLDRSPLRSLVEVNWVSLGQLPLTPGPHTLRIELTNTEGPAAFDCFLLTAHPFYPKGKLQPNQRLTAQIPGGFLFNPPADPFTPSPIDLRFLNEAVAGENGFIQVQGDTFTLGNTGKPVRFWAVNAGNTNMSPELLAQTARFLAKQGVNMARVHMPFWAEDLRSLDPAKLEYLFNFVEAMKQEGIYTCLSIYFPVWLDMQAQYGFEGYSGQKPFALLFFNPDFQQIYREWWKTLLTTPNPKTGKTLRDEPALSMVELLNEDSYFFWTFQPYETVPAPQMALLEQQFGAWLTRKYGAIATALSTWGKGATVRGDDPATQRVGILPLAELLKQRESQRARDTATFLADSQQSFFTGAIAHLRQTLNYKGLIYASNWVTANTQILGPLDKYTNTVGDFMDRHGYFSPPHEGSPSTAYAINPGETYQDQSALLFRNPQNPKTQDFNLPIMDIQYADKPSTITEVNWTLPNRFRADFPVLAATYGALQGTDGIFFFATANDDWDSSLSKFAIATPTIMGQFPATALIYRQGLVKPGEAVVDITLKPDDLMNLQGAPVSAPQNLDALRANDLPAGQLWEGDRADSLDPLAFLVGQVKLNFGPQASAKQKPLADYIDRKAQTVTSSTNELRWDYAKGIATVNAPKAQGITGFLHANGPVQLATVEINPTIDYGTVLLVPLDNQPLAQSNRMLLQVMSEEQNLGWRTTGSPTKTIQTLGQPSLAIRNLGGTVRLRRSPDKPLKVTALDFNGYPTASPQTTTKITLQPNVFYYLIEAA